MHLSDTTIYKPLDKDRMLEVVDKANWAARHHAALKTIGHWTEGTLHKPPQTTRTQEMYFLRKMHKTPHKIRPIVSCSSGPTEKISGYLCRLLNPFLEDVHSLVTNSQQVIQVIESLDLSAHSNVSLVSLDVEALRDRDGSPAYLPNLTTPEHTECPKELCQGPHESRNP